MGNLVAMELYFEASICFRPNSSPEESTKAVERVRNLAKGLLAKDSFNIPLWNVYAQIESLLGFPNEAKRVYEMALAMIQSFPEAGTLFFPFIFLFPLKYFLLLYLENILGFFTYFLLLEYFLVLTLSHFLSSSASTFPNSHSLAHRNRISKQQLIEFERKNSFHHFRSE